MRHRRLDMPAVRDFPFGIDSTPAVVDPDRLHLNRHGPPGRPQDDGPPLRMAEIDNGLFQGVISRHRI